MGYNPLASGSLFQGASRQTGTGYQNGTGSTLSKATLVSTNTSGQLIKLDVSIEATALAVVGFCSADIPSAAFDTVVDNGRLENVTTAFGVGDPIWAGKTPGTITNLKPGIGVAGFIAGDFVVFLGVIVENQFNPSLKDIKILMSITGQL